MTNYEVTIGYRAVISVSVKAYSEQEAKEKAIQQFQKERKKFCNHNGVSIQDDRYAADGVVNQDETWNVLY